MRQERNRRRRQENDEEEDGEKDHEEEKRSSKRRKYEIDYGMEDENENNKLVDILQDLIEEKNDVLEPVSDR